MGRHQKDFTAFGDGADFASALALGTGASANDVATTTAMAMAARGDGFGVSDGGSVASSASQGTYAQLADYLVNGYWAKDGITAHGWTAGSTVTFNVTGLSTLEQSYARTALNLWHEVANINFSEVTSGGQITFDDSGSMQAVTNVSWGGGGVLTSANVHISTDWVNTNGGYGGATGIWSYGFQTYLHELGHAMGLGHQGPYDGSATWGVDNIFTNDSWQYTVMSYFDQTESGLASFDFAITPMVVDILAMQTKYGANTTTRVGDTTYGFNSTAGSFYNFSSYAGAPAFTIYDAGGTDTLDCSGFSQSQIFNMTGGGYCSVGGQTNNIGIALSTLLENAIGGSGADTFNGNALNNTFRGNLGNDTINGGDGIDTAIFSGNRASYTLTDLGGGSVRVVGADGTDTLNSIEKLQFADQTITWGQTAHPESDFGGDGISDILWRSNTGQIAVWQLDNTGHVVSAQAAGTLASSWHVEDTGDFNNDGNADILWRNDSGQIALWTMDGSHVTSAISLGTLASSWEIQGAVDFNGDGTSDILWRNSTNGNVVVWNTDGAGHVTSTTNLGIVNNAYHIQALDDFNGDGTDDILWRNDNGQVALWQMNGSGVSSAGTVSTLATTWHIQESGDFNGDGKTDILWRSDAGQIAVWSMDGAHVTNAASIGTLSSAWQVETTGDYNGDGKDDILWQNTTTGQAVEWLMNGSQVVGTVDLGKLPAWDVQHHDFDIV